MEQSNMKTRAMPSDVSAKYNSLSSHPLFMKTEAYKTLKNQPMGFLDIGARGGAHPLVEPVANLTAVLGFEPDEEACAEILADKNLKSNWGRFDLEPIAVADKAGDGELHLIAAPTNHSLRAPNTDFTHRYKMPKWEEVGRWPLKTERLDTILFDKRAQENFWGEFIKVDTQGTEFEIFEGSPKTLTERTVAIVSEVAFCELYKGQKLFSDVEQQLRQHGFAFYGFYSYHTRSLRQIDKKTGRAMERAMYADAVFFKDPLPGSQHNKPLSTRQNQILFVCALLLGYYDFGLELALKTWASKEEAETIKQLIQDLSHYDPKQAAADVTALNTQVGKHPEKANQLVGKFIDGRRKYFDYDDVIL